MSGWTGFKLIFFIILFARVKKFTNWIINFVGTKNLCWDEKFTKTLKDGNLKDD